MTEHVHEWKEKATQYEGQSHLWFECAGCSVPITPEEIVRRLNATEILRGRDAEWIADKRYLDIGELEQLRAYAAALPERLKGDVDER